MTDRALLTTLHQTQSAFERQRGITVGHEGWSFRWLDPPRQRPTFHPAQLPRRERSPLLFIQAEIGAVVRGVKAGEFDCPT
jgi:hypothetical protein